MGAWIDFNSTMAEKVIKPFEKYFISAAPGTI